MISCEQSALAEQSARAFRIASRLRAFAVFVFLPLVAWHSYRGDPGSLKPLVPYALFAAAIYQLRARQWVHQVGAFSFLVDALFLFALQQAPVPAGSSSIGVAGISLGLFMLLVVFAGASMHCDATLATAFFAAPLQVVLLRQAGVGLDGQLAAVVVLAATALAQVGLVRWLVTMVRSAVEFELAHRLETERTRAHASIAKSLDAAVSNHDVERVEAGKAPRAA